MNNQNKKKRIKIFNRDIILEHLVQKGEISANILLNIVWAMLQTAGAMMSPISQVRHALGKCPTPPPFEINIKSKVAFWSLLSKLKKENLIAKGHAGNIIITKRGREYMKNKSEKLPRQKIYQVLPLSHEFILVIFDIPEENRIKRDWLRFQLTKFGFQFLQKSVWWGQCALPKEFIKDLKKYEILPYVHIFSVKKEGTISEILKKI